MLLCKAFLIFSTIVSSLLATKCICLCLSQDLHHASFAQTNKKAIAVFPFRNNTSIPNLQESIPDLLRGELFRSGFFEIIERDRLYKTIWRIAISDLVKIDNASVVSRERFSDQEVDLFSKLERAEIERISDFVDADYTIKGAVNQFGSLIRIELEILDVYTKKTLNAMSADVNDVESIPNAIKDFIPSITGLCAQENIEEIADEILGQYRGGMITFEKTVANLKEIASLVHESIYANTQLLILYKERGFRNETTQVCKSIIFTISQYNEGTTDILSRLGIDPFDILAGLYYENNRLQDAADVYANAIKTIPLNTAIYYKKLGVIFLRQEKLQDAIEALKHSIELNLADFQAHYQLGIAFEKGNQYGEALNEYKQCLKYTGGRNKHLPIEVVRRKIKELERLTF